MSIVTAQTTWVYAAAARARVPVVEYIYAINRGLHWCSRGQHWRRQDRFGVCRARYNGLMHSCKECLRHRYTGRT